MACHKHGKYPGDRTNDIKEHEFLPVHFYHSGDYRCKSSYYRQEARKHNRLSSMLFVKLLSLVEMFFLEKESVLAFKQEGTAFLSEPVSGHITKYATDGDKHEQDHDI
jgi:hypothetical protein